MASSSLAARAVPRDAALDLLKWLAFASMVLDHLRYVRSGLDMLYLPGRLAFPLFCLAIAANLARRPETRQLPWRYLGGLLLFAVLAEGPYRLFIPLPDTFNVLPTLVLGLLIADGLQGPRGIKGGLALGALLVAGVLRERLMFGLSGALLPAALLLALRFGPRAWPLAALVGLAANSWPDLYLRAAEGQPFWLLVILICLAAPVAGLWLLRRGLPGRVPPVRRWAYLAYPGHFLLLWLLRESGLPG
ncbi:MAG: TraX family protein [Pseudomonadota bacterium]